MDRAARYTSSHEANWRGVAEAGAEYSLITARSVAEWPSELSGRILPEGLLVVEPDVLFIGAPMQKLIESNGTCRIGTVGEDLQVLAERRVTLTRLSAP